MMAGLLAHLVALALAGANPLATWARQTPTCSAEVRHCFGLDVRVAVTGDAPVVDVKWLSAQVTEANRLFGVIRVGFQVDRVSTLDGKWARIDTRLERDQLGRRPRRPGVVDVFVVQRLADVDIAGEEIRGVHWRDRAQTDRRHIILSSISQPLVLAHELGHFFGLPHGSHPRSIMNKKPREKPPHEERGFVAGERKIMEREREKMLRAGRLVPR